MVVELKELYSPLWAPHVKGRYSRLEVDPETGEREEQRVEAEVWVEVGGWEEDWVLE